MDTTSSHLNEIWMRFPELMYGGTGCRQFPREPLQFDAVLEGLPLGTRLLARTRWKRVTLGWLIAYGVNAILTKRKRPLKITGMMKWFGITT